MLRFSVPPGYPGYPDAGDARVPDCILALAREKTGDGGIAQAHALLGGHRSALQHRAHGLDHRSSVTRHDLAVVGLQRTATCFLM